MMTEATQLQQTGTKSIVACNKLTFRGFTGELGKSNKYTFQDRASVPRIICSTARTQAGLFFSP